MNITLGARKAGQLHPCFVIAEASANRNQTCTWALESADTDTDTADAITFGSNAPLFEKHFTLGYAAVGPDSAFSLEPHEFAGMVRHVRDIETALDEVSYDVQPSARSSRLLARPLFDVADASTGDALTPENVQSIRPSNGLARKLLPTVPGRRFARDVTAGTPLSTELIGGSLDGAG